MVLILRLGGWVVGGSVGPSEIKANSASIVVEVEVEVEAELVNIQLYRKSEKWPQTC